MRDNEPLFSHLFIRSKDQCVEQYAFDTLNLVKLLEVTERNNVLKNADNREFKPV